MKTVTQLIALVATLLCHTAAAKQPLKVYILAGQSNMEGTAKTSTFDYIADDPATKHLYDMTQGDSGGFAVAENVYVSNYAGFGDDNGVVNGKLSVGYGARRNPRELGECIGPEYTFGLTMAKQYDGPILIIKTAWGGKSLHTDFRPQSAGPYELNEWQLEMYPKQTGHGIPKDFAQWKIDKKKATGVYYRMMVDHVQKVLANPGEVVPDYDEEAGYEIAGFVWFQGWNDMVDSHTYPWKDGAQRYDLYSELLSLFISDVRKDFNTPSMPFVIGVMGVGGEQNENKSWQNFRQAMAAPAHTMKNVAAVPTAPYWDEPLAAVEAKREKINSMAYLLRTENKNHPNADGSMTADNQRAYLDKMRAELITSEDEALWERGASNAGYHYLGCGKTFALIGEAFAKALIEMK